MSHELCFEGFFIGLQKEEAPNSPRKNRLLLRSAEALCFTS